MLKYGDCMPTADNRVSMEAGKAIVEDMKRKGFSLKEALRFKEDITTTNSAALYTTALASVIRHAVEPNLIGLELLQINTDMMNGKGTGAIKLPKERRVTAAIVAEGGSVTYTSEGYDYITLVPEKRVAAAKITWEMAKRSMVSQIVREAERAGKALARRIDQDILSGITNVCTSANGNRIPTGGATTRVSYINIVDAKALVQEQYFKPTHLILHPDDYAALQKDTDFKQFLIRAVIPAGIPITVAPKVEYFGDMKVVISPLLTTGKTLLVDVNELGTFAKETDVEVFDARVPGSLDTEVLAVQSYAVGIENVRAAAMIEMAAL